MITQTEIKEELKALIADYMYMDIDEIEEQELFSDFGLESITLIKILDKLSKKYGFKAEIKELLPHQTVLEATDFFFDRIAKVEA
ncbi:MAG: hypothetical protein C9356_20035 [Oleiphilus sp.]|nr:MAG: hypothetical protein C9356_20035 [Oleiphilus sp.]